MKALFKKFKFDPVLFAAWILAIASAFFVHPDREYVGYIDFRSLGILWSLMVVIQGLKENSVFEKIAIKLLKKVNTGTGLSFSLIIMCFFGSMLITNDVALITFVPFAIMLLHSCKRDDLVILVVALQTVAANLGSMLTPIGNPQNLYLYGVTGMHISEFILCMLPYTLLTLVILMGIIFLLPNGKKKIQLEEGLLTVEKFGSNKQIALYLVMFTLAILSVLRIIPWYVVVIAILLLVAGMDFKILFQADYVLLLTFIGFFIFTGNIARIPQVHEFMGRIVGGREFATAIIASQVISNVPATFLLSDFATSYKELLCGVNIGGLGTLIASMASLISYKSFSNSYSNKKGHYVIVFTIVNLAFLGILVGLHLLIA